ncbi:MAG: hypothetical protein J1F01_10035 [Oscillospiraceae bacterium]|nr:hypothetical protein [Oscillospiraceae bacterium]
MYFQSFAVGLAGLVFLAKDLGHVWPYSLMAYNAPQELTQSGYGQFISVCVVYIIAFTIIGSVIAARRDI